MNCRSWDEGAKSWAMSVVVKARQWSLIGGVWAAKRSGINHPNLKWNKTGLQPVSRPVPQEKNKNGLSYVSGT